MRNTSSALRFLLVPLSLLLACQASSIATATGDSRAFPTPAAKECSDPSFSLRLPETFIGAEPQSIQVGTITRWLEGQGFETTPFENWINNVTYLEFFALDKEFDSNLTYAYLTLSCVEAQPEFTLDHYQLFYLDQLNEGETLVATGEIEVDGKKTKTITYDFLQGADEVRDAVYVLESNGVFWKFEFHSPVSEFELRKDTFLDILESFKPE